MAKKQAAAVSVADLIRAALLNIANATEDMKLSGKGGLFASAAGANKEAIEECLNAATPLLTVVRTEGKSQIVALAPAGFERIAKELPDEKVGVLAKSVAVAMPLAARIEFIQDVIGRTPLASVELLPVLEEAVAAEKAEQEARIETARKRREAEEAMLTALKRVTALFEERRAARLDALRREYEIEGGKASELPQPPAKVEAAATKERDERRDQVVPMNERDRNFQRETADQLASAWRQAWDAKKAEALEYLEAAMWNISALKPGEEAGTRLVFDGRYHECERPVFTGDAVKIVRPGWVLEESPNKDYVALKAVVEKA